MDLVGRETVEAGAGIVIGRHDDFEAGEVVGADDGQRE